MKNIPLKTEGTQEMNINEMKEYNGGITLCALTAAAALFSLTVAGLTSLVQSFTHSTKKSTP